MKTENPKQTKREISFSVWQKNKSENKVYERKATSLFAKSLKENEKKYTETKQKLYDYEKKAFISEGGIEKEYENFLSAQKIFEKTGLDAKLFNKKSFFNVKKETKEEQKPEINNEQKPEINKEQKPEINKEQKPEIKQEEVIWNTTSIPKIVSSASETEKLPDVIWEK